MTGSRSRPGGIRKRKYKTARELREIYPEQYHNVPMSQRLPDKDIIGLATSNPPGKGPYGGDNVPRKTWANLSWKLQSLKEQDAQPGSEVITPVGASFYRSMNKNMWPNRPFFPKKIQKKNRWKFIFSQKKWCYNCFKNLFKNDARIAVVFTVKWNKTAFRLIYQTMEKMHEKMTLILQKIWNSNSRPMFLNLLVFFESSSPRITKNQILSILISIQWMPD